MSVLNVIILLALSLFQTIHLKRYFQAKKVWGSKERRREGTDMARQISLSESKPESEAGSQSTTAVDPGHQRAQSTETGALALRFLLLIFTLPRTVD
jgi:hypothetical protein